MDPQSRAIFLFAYASRALFISFSVKCSLINKVLYSKKYPTSDRFNPLRPNSDLSQTSHCNIKGLSVSEVMRTENMITQVKFY